MESRGTLKAYPPLTGPTDVPLCSSSSQISVTENHMGSVVNLNTSIKGGLLGKDLNIEATIKWKVVSGIFQKKVTWVSRETV